jgi:hypothetical protein
VRDQASGSAAPRKLIGFGRFIIGGLVASGVYSFREIRLILLCCAIQWMPTNDDLSLMETRALIGQKGNMLRGGFIVFET